MTTIDFPGALSAVLFLQGCPWRCPYCHNAAFQPMENDKPLIPWSRVRKFFEERKGLLDAVVFSGGEATIHPGLKDAMREAHSFGYKIGLHTNGAFPARVKELLAEGLLDWVGLDIKAPRWLYAPMTGTEATGGAAWETLRLLLASGVPVEIRATLYRPVLDDYEVLRLAAELREAGARQLKLQPWRPAAAPGEIVLEENLAPLQSEVDDILRGAAQFSFTERVMEGDESLTTPMPPAALPAATATPAA